MEVFNFRMPDRKSSEYQEITADELDYGDGYSQIVLHGIRPRKDVLDLTWTLPYDEGITLFKWLKSVEKATPFLYTHFKEGQKQWRAHDVKMENNAPTHVKVSAKFKQDYNIYR